MSSPSSSKAVSARFLPIVIAPQPPTEWIRTAAELGGSRFPSPAEWRGSPPTRGGGVRRQRVPPTGRVEGKPAQPGIAVAQLLLPDLELGNASVVPDEIHPEAELSPPRRPGRQAAEGWGE